MAGVFLLLVLCVVMALASFLAGALPLSVSLSNSHLRLLSSIGVGILVGTSLIIIIPEGIEAAAAPSSAGHVHKVRSLIRRSPISHPIDAYPIHQVQTTTWQEPRKEMAREEDVLDRVLREEELEPDLQGDESPSEEEPQGHEDEDEHLELPTLEIGLSLILGFILMFLIDRLPRHATERLNPPPETQHMSLEDLGGAEDPDSVDEAEGFLGSLTPSPRQARSLATTTGLVIHAAADGIAMGATSTSSDLKLGFIIFLAIMIHKAPASFGLTSILLKQGLSKRAARGHLIVFSLAAPFGALTTWFIITLLGGDHLEGESKQWWTGMLLLFSGGTFLYVAMQAMQEDGHGHAYEGDGSVNGYGESVATSQRKPKGPQVRDTLATAVGMLLPLLAQFGHAH